MDDYQTALGALKHRVFEANMRLHRSGLVPLTFGNVSEKLILGDGMIFAIKPSGVAYDQMRPEDIVVLDATGKVVDGKLRPSSDSPTHLQIYNNLPHWSGVTHTHSTFATSWAQAGKAIPIYGTTHADYSRLPIPCTPVLTPQSIFGEYEQNTGIAIVNHMIDKGPRDSSMVIVGGHGPFSFGKDANASVEAAIALEEIAKLAFYTVQLNPQAPILSPQMVSKHYDRKHGANKYYGQN